MATLLFQTWEKGLKEEQKDMREVGNERRGWEKSRLEENKQHER